MAWRRATRRRSAGSTQPPSRGTRRETSVSNKFWRGLVIGNKYIVNYGKQGTNGTFNQKTFDSEEAAEKQLEKDIEVKQKKGYEISEDDE